MSYQPHLHKGGELYHARTFGSKNGISNTPGYRAKGRKAVGRFVGVDSQGHPIYDYSQRNPAPNQRYQQQQRINAAVATNAGAKGQSARELRERHANADIANARRQDIANYNSLGARLNRTGKQIGNWLNERGSRASNFISNIAKRARTAIGDARTAIGNAWDGKAGRGSALDDYNDRMSKSANARTKSGAAALRKGAENAKSAYDRSIVGRFNAAREWMGGAANRARTAIGNAWDGSAGKGTGLDRAAEATNKANRHSKAANIYGNMGDVSNSVRARRDAAVEKANARKAQQAYDRSIVGTGERLLNRAGQAIRGGAAAVSSGAKRAGKAVSDSYVRSGASNTTKTLMTKGPIQEIKNDRSYFGGREAQQAKGNKLNVQNANRSAQERKQYVQQVDRDWGNAQRYLDRLTDKANSAKNEKDRQKALANIDRFMTETYKPLQTAYNNVHKNRK